MSRCVKYLLENGEDPNFKAHTSSLKHEYYPLDMAWNWPYARLLFQFGARVASQECGRMWLELLPLCESVKNLLLCGEDFDSTLAIFPIEVRYVISLQMARVWAHGRFVRGIYINHWSLQIKPQWWSYLASLGFANDDS